MCLRHRAFGFCTLLFLVIAICAPTARAGDAFAPISPEELKMTSEPLAPGAPAIILYRQVDRDDSGNQGRQYNYVRIKILTEEGRKYADVEIPYSKDSGRDVVGVKARTIRPDGTIVNYDGKIYQKPIVKAKGVKYMAKTFTMPDVQVGGIIEYGYTEILPEYYVYDSHWILSDELFTKSAKFSLKPYARFACRWSWHRLPRGSAEPKAGPDKIIRLEVNNIPAFPSEDFMPPANELKARVDFTYSETSFEPDADKFWKKKGRDWNGALEDFVGKRKAMEQAVAQIVSASDTPEVKLRKIYARVQELRNTSYEIRKSEQEARRENLKDINNVEDLWKRGYGSGVQLTWLFLGLVRAAGLEAYGVWASDRLNYFFDAKMMDDNKLDANVVLVKLNGKDMYFDPGAKFMPFGLLPWSETGVPGLRLDKDGGSWVTTYLPDSSVSRIDRKASLRVSETGDLEGEVTMKFTGLEAVRARLEERHDDDSDRKKYLEDTLKEQIPVAAEVQLTNKPDWASSSPDFVAEFKLKVSGWMSGAGRRAMLPTGLFTAAEKNVFAHTERIHPIYFEFPFSKEDDVTIALPLGWEVSSVPPEQNEGGNPVLYSFKAEKDGGSLHFSRKLRVDLLVVNTKYYPALRNFFQVVRTGDEQQAVLRTIDSRAGK